MRKPEWYKMYINSIRDVKFRKLAKRHKEIFPHIWTLWTMILDEAALNGGVAEVDDDEEDVFDVVADTLPMGVELSTLIDLLTDAKLIYLGQGGLVVKNFEKYQHESLSTKRVQDHRKNKEIEDNVTEVILMFNKITDSRYSTKTEATRESIRARLNEGRTMAEIRAVITDRKKKWQNDPKMKIFIRPSTIFRPAHFDNYLNEIPAEHVAASNDGTLLRVRNIYNVESEITQEQYDKAADGFYTILD